MSKSNLSYGTHQTVFVCCVTAGRTPEHPETDESSAEEAEPAGPGERQPEERAQQGHPGSQQAGEPLQGAAETQPHTQGTQPAPLSSI